MPSRLKVIAIDGPAGAGKSTIARMAARALGWRYVDTGAMYRAIALSALREGIPLADSGSLARLAARVALRVRNINGEFHVFLNGEDVTRRIRTARVTAATHQVAAVKGVRRRLVAIQRAMGRRGRIVMEGRDIGTKVFPDARWKFYLDARPAERALRRWRELRRAGRRVSLRRIEEAIRRRDRKDRERGISPLRVARDAVVVDTTHLTLAQVAEKILERVRSS